MRIELDAMHREEGSVYTKIRRWSNGGVVANPTKGFGRDDSASFRWVFEVQCCDNRGNNGGEMECTKTVLLVSR